MNHRPDSRGARALVRLPMLVQRPRDTRGRVGPADEGAGGADEGVPARLRGPNSYHK